MCCCIHQLSCIGEDVWVKASTEEKRQVACQLPDRLMTSEKYKSASFEERARTQRWHEKGRSTSILVKDPNNSGWVDYLVLSNSTGINFAGAGILTGCGSPKGIPSLVSMSQLARLSCELRPLLDA